MIGQGQILVWEAALGTKGRSHAEDATTLRALDAAALAVMDARLSALLAHGGTLGPVTLVARGTRVHAIVAGCMDFGGRPYGGIACSALI